MKKLQTLSAKQKALLNHCIEFGSDVEFKTLLKPHLEPADCVLIGELTSQSREEKTIWAQVYFLKGSDIAGSHYVYFGEWNCKLWRCDDYEEVYEVIQALKIDFAIEVLGIEKAAKKNKAA